MEQYDMLITHGNVDTQTTRNAVTAILYRQDVTLMLNDINVPAT